MTKKHLLILLLLCSAIIVLPFGFRKNRSVFDFFKPRSLADEKKHHKFIVDIQTLDEEMEDLNLGVVEQKNNASINALMEQFSLFRLSPVSPNTKEYVTTNSVYQLDPNKSYKIYHYEFSFPAPKTSKETIRRYCRLKDDLIAASSEIQRKAIRGKLLKIATENNARTLMTETELFPKKTNR